MNSKKILIGFRRSLLFELKHIIFDLFDLKFGGQTIDLQGNVRDSAHIVAQCADTLPAHDELSLQRPPRYTQPLPASHLSRGQLGV
ncbi:hypothetical protein WBG78_09865 [Chryseolinea sp. T2]|uniref:hypothetical protein n=1 Tax=Chryseolinea sp. T2 TaxID=3129255 RepID=UPI003076A73C